jgi:hypothetical protein
VGVEVAWLLAGTLSRAVMVVRRQVAFERDLFKIS